VDQIADLYALQQHLGFKQIDLLGHSWGGFLAMAYSIHHPLNVHKLIIVDSAAPKLGDTVFLFEPVFPETMERKNALASRVESGDPDAMREDLRAYLSMLCYSLQKRDEFLSAADGFIYRSEVERILWADAEKLDLGPELTRLSQQTLVISGRYDMNVAPSVAYKIHRAIHSSQFVVFEQSGHLPFFEETALFQEKVRSFLD
jgi:proline iminopeptidase